MLASQLKSASDQDRMDGPQYWSQEMMVMKPPPPHPPLPSTSSITTRPHRNPHKEQRPLNCPRCNSSYTKFCYYNNYSLSQPRYFCKSCRRYWTEGGSLRNVPVGGGSRKNKRSSSYPNISNKPAVDCTAPNPKFNEADYHPQHQQRRHGEDLNLSFTTPQHPNLGNSPSSMDVLSTSTAAVYSGGGGFGLQDLRSSTIANSGLNFPINGDMGMGEAWYDHCQKLEQNRGDEADSSSGFWNCRK